MLISINIIKLFVNDIISFVDDYVLSLKDFDAWFAELDMYINS